MPRMFAPTLFLGLAMGLVSCGDEEVETPADTGEAGLTLTIHATIDPDPPLVDQNTMDIHVTDSAELGVEGCEITVDPQMPAHGHGSPEVPVVTDQGSGTYKAFPVTLSMPGTWEITVEAEHADTQASGTAVFTYVVE